MIRNFFANAAVLSLKPSIRPVRLGGLYYHIVFHFSFVLECLIPLSIHFNIGNGRSAVLSMIGHNMLSVLLLENVMRKTDDEGLLTYTRDTQLSVDRLASHAGRVLVPDVISEEEFALLSSEERKELLEAYIGAAYETCGYHMPRHLRLACFDIITPSEEQTENHTEDKTQIYNVTEKLDDFKELLKKVSRKPPRSQLQILLQKRGYDATKAIYSYESRHASDPLQPPFIAKFELTDELVPYGLPVVGEISSELKRSKREAADHVAEQVLTLFYGHSKTADKSIADNEKPDWHWKLKRRKIAAVKKKPPKKSTTLGLREFYDFDFSMS